MQQVIHDNHTIEDKLWQIAAPRLAENILVKKDKYKKIKHSELQKWLVKDEPISAKKVRSIDLKNKTAILFTGKAIISNNENIEAPCLINDSSVTLSRDSRIFLCKKTN